MLAKHYSEAPEELRKMESRLQNLAMELKLSENKVHVSYKFG